MFSFESKVRYSEIDFTNHLPAWAIVDYFQDCSNFHSESDGVGLKFLNENNATWLLTSWQIEIKRSPSLCEKIKISTWPYEFKGFFGYRNFLMEDENGNPLAYANSTWVYFNVKTQRPQKADADFASIYGLEAPYKMEYLDRKLRLPDDAIPGEKFRVMREHLDTNMHVNNVQHIKLAENLLPLDFDISRVRVDYRNQAFPNSIITPMTSYTDGVFTVGLCNDEGKPYSIVSFSERK